MLAAGDLNAPHSYVVITDCWCRGAAGVDFGVFNRQGVPVAVDIYVAVNTRVLYDDAAGLNEQVSVDGFANDSRT